MEILFPPSCGFRRARKRPLKVYAVLKLVLRMKSPNMGMLLPLLPFGIKCYPLTWECCLPPSCWFPPKSFPLKREPTISGDTFGTRARGHPRTAPPRRRHVMPLAMRPLREENGALLAHVPSALGTHTVAAALKRASPCERLVSGSTSNQITSCQATSRSEFSLNRLRKRNVVLKYAPNKCTSQAPPPTHPVRKIT